MEKLSLEKFANKQIEMKEINGGIEQEGFFDYTTSEAVLSDDHDTGSGGCGINHETGCHHHTADYADGTTAQYVGCGVSEKYCSL